MPKDLFYGTGIGSYVWILNNNKPANRRGKVQLINGIHPTFTKKIKSLGKKQYEISDEGIALITSIYKAYKPYCIEVEENGQSREVEVSKLYDVADFKYTKVRVERPLRLSYEITTEKIEVLKSRSKFKELASSKKKDRAAAAVDIIKGEAIQLQTLRALEGLSSQGRIGDDAIFFKLLAKGLGSKPNKSFLKVYREAQ